MGEKWNLRSLKAPPVYHVRANNMDIETLVILKNTIGDVVDALSKQDVLDSERLCLQRILYKLNNQMRHQKLFSFFKLISKCLRCYVNLDLLTLMKSLHDEFQRLVEQYEEQQYVPSLQTLQYHMVKLQCAAGILARMATYCIQAYFPVKQVMAIGHFLTKNIMFLAMLGRVWALSKYLIFGITKGFNQLLPLLSKFPASPILWLPEDEKLPPDLSAWIKTNWPEVDVNFKGITTNQDAKEMKSAEKAESSTAQWDIFKSSNLFGAGSDTGVPVSNEEDEMDESTESLPPLDMSSSVSVPVDVSSSVSLPVDVSSSVSLPVDVSSSVSLPVDVSSSVSLPVDVSSCVSLPVDVSSSVSSLLFGQDEDIGVAHHEMRSTLADKTDVNSVTLDFNSVLFLKTLREAKSCEEFSAPYAALRHSGRLWKGNRVWLKEELKKIDRTIQKLQSGRPKKKKIAHCRNRISKVFNTLMGGVNKGNHLTSPKPKMLLPIIHQCISSLSSVKKAKVSLTQNQQIKLGPFYTLHLPKAIAGAILQNFKEIKKRPGNQTCKPVEVFLAAVKSVLVKVCNKKVKDARVSMKTETESLLTAGTRGKVKRKKTRAIQSDGPKKKNKNRHTSKSLYNN
ncbi:uncharacterized protein LOC135466565 [Liolophura sinensis]|uniref:uncharacterized protein LOC135466565 n=1 Tax=Liolophura sinensis TaxID=3198878 RepID=UPI0031595937